MVACAIFSSGGVKCWGSNMLYGLGQSEKVAIGCKPTDMSSLQFLPFGSSHRALSISAESTETSHMCVVFDGGGIRCWGQNDYGQVGIGARQKYVPGPISSLSFIAFSDSVPAVQVSASMSHTCAVFNNGRFRCKQKFIIS